MLSLKFSDSAIFATNSMRRRPLISPTAVLIFGSLFSLLTFVGLLGKLKNPKIGEKTNTSLGWPYFRQSSRNCRNHWRQTDAQKCDE